MHFLGKNHGFNLISIEKQFSLWKTLFSLAKTDRFHARHFPTRKLRVIHTDCLLSRIPATTKSRPQPNDKPLSAQSQIALVLPKPSDAVSSNSEANKLSSSKRLTTKKKSYSQHQKGLGLKVISGTCALYMSGALHIKTAGQDRMQWCATCLGSGFYGLMHLSWRRINEVAGRELFISVFFFDRKMNWLIEIWYFSELFFIDCWMQWTAHHRLYGRD